MAVTTCVKYNANTSDTSVRDETEKIHDDIAAENIDYVNISGNAIVSKKRRCYYRLYRLDVF